MPGPHGRAGPDGRADRRAWSSHWHGDVIRQRRTLKLYEPLQTLAVLRRADAVVVTSPYAESSAVLAPWRSKVKVIPIGISDNRGSACSVQAAALRQRFGQRRIVFALGRMTYYKGIRRTDRRSGYPAGQLRRC